MSELDLGWLALSLIQNIGNKTLANLLDVFGSTEAILNADKASLMAVRGIGAKIADSILAIELESLEKQLNAWQKAGVKVILQPTPNYPSQLRQIADPPLSLFLRGNYQVDKWEKVAAIVGTRNPSRQGTYLATKLAKNLTEAGWWIVSGLALGIDAAAHQAALDRGRTFAILGGGVLNIYPPQHEKLAQEIMQTGAILSENPPYANATAPRLVTRNRLISAFCQKLIVVETSSDGGAMHAARAAIEQGRQVYTFDLKASGNQQLLQEGASLMDTACQAF